MALYPSANSTFTPLKSVAKKQAGQVTIFFAVLIIVIMGLIAFVVNVGLFVKAKINFQNAVDAAAWSGAAVQSRQLTNIAYLNWELHNTYKEWMFKYYVLGQHSLNHTHKSDPNWSAYNSPGMSFRGRVFNDPTTPDPTKFDPYNIPTTCIHPAGNNVNICQIFDVPGIPRFDPMGIPGMDDEQTAFVDAITSQKGKDCARRSALNFQTQLQWIYGVKSGSQAIPGAPEIAAGRMGAWPEALEIALRMRNLEMMVNRPPLEDGICLTQAQAGSSCAHEIESLYQSDAGSMPVNERPVKAFLSASKSLGGVYQGRINELKSNLVLYEIGADSGQLPVSGAAKTLSTFLIPAAGYNVFVTQPQIKYYLDLKIIPVNLVNFFTTFVATSGSFSGISTDAECVGSKTAMPVPGYIFGFAKNPDVLTYYAVKAETKYIGLLFPFTDEDGITMKAYAAAKPFGGRIGPHLFDTTSDTRNTSIKAISGVHAGHQKTSPFISGLELPGTTQAFKPGDPIPLVSNFWIENAGDILGGIPAAGQRVLFGVPNMLYDVIPGQMAAQQSSGNTQIPILTRAVNKTSAYGSQTPTIGLYNVAQYQELSHSFQNISMDVNSIAQAVNEARRPTRYDALNYMIPTVSENNSGVKFDSSSAISQTDISLKNDIGMTPGVYRYSMYAPLFHDQGLYRTANDITAIITSYISANESAMTTFLEAYFEVAKSIRDTNAGGIYNDAGDGIHDNRTNKLAPTCASIAGQFNAFFSGVGLSHPSCASIIPLETRLTTYWNDRSTAEPNFQNLYVGTYTIPTSARNSNGRGLTNSDIMTAYAPGINHNADSGDENITYPYTNTRYKARRNSYSTKFIPIDRLIESPTMYTTSYIGSSLPTTFDFEDPTLRQKANVTVNFTNSIKRSKLSDFKTLDH